MSSGSMRRIKRLVLIAAQVALLGPLTSCSHIGIALAPFDKSQLVDDLTRDAALLSVKRFDQVSGILRLDSSEPFTAGAGAGQLRLGFFANSSGQLRLDLYPALGFVAVASAVLGPSRITAVDRIEKIGVESERVSQTLKQLSGFGFTTEELILALVGRSPQALAFEASSAAVLDSGAVVLRTPNQRSEIEILGGEIQRVTVVARDGGRVTATRRMASPSWSAPDAISGDIVFVGSDSLVGARTTYSISNLSFSRLVAPKVFTLDTGGYRMRTRLQ